MNYDHPQKLEISGRSLEYAFRAVKLFQFLQEKNDPAAYIIGKQYLRAATSIGANIAEAQSGESKADFIHKCSISQKEARESLYWLHLFAKSEIVPSNRLKNLMQETDELIAIITTIIVNTKKNLKS